jgi:glycosyltransferase involved in cell wall biosynthesis
MRISVVTPSFNMARFLGDTIASVLANLGPGDEYFIIDGGSTDGSREIIERHAQRLTGWVSEADRGYAHALAKGFDRATGEVLCWVNASDLLLPGALEAVRKVMAAHPVDMIYGDIFDVDEEANVISRSSGRMPWLKYYMLYGGGAPWQVGCFWRREAYRAVGGIRPEMRLAADYDFFLRLSVARPVRYVPLVLGAHRHHTGQLSIAQAEEYREERLAIRRALVQQQGQSVLTRLALTFIFWPYVRIRARAAMLSSRRDPLRGMPLAGLRCE